MQTFIDTTPENVAYKEIVLVEETFEGDYNEVALEKLGKILNATETSDEEDLSSQAVLFRY